MAMNDLRAQKQHSIEGTIGGASTNISIDMGPITLAYNVQVTNDDSTNEISVKLNSTSYSDITIKAGETQTFNRVPVKYIYLSNSSGSTVAFRIAITGE